MEASLRKFLLGKKLITTLIGLGVFYLLFPSRFAVKYEFIPIDQINLHIVSPSTPKVNSCQIPKLSMQEALPPKYYKFNQSDYALKLKIQNGGMWKPDNCEYSHNIALVIPCRKRLKQLNIFLHYIHPFLQKQLLSYRIFVIEQTFFKAFNRGLLMNIGFLEAMKTHSFDCFIFHDVDLIPLVEMNIYACSNQPRHLSAAINTWRYNLKYITSFGGVIAILQKHFYLINGFSNEYSGWGGEDDDLIKRIIKNGLGFCRFSPEISKYHMLHHRAEKKNPNRTKKLKEAYKRFKNDGINSVNYTKVFLAEKSLYTHVLVDI